MARDDELAQSAFLDLGHADDRACEVQFNAFGVGPYILYRGNHPELAYRGGQVPIVHLEADLRETVARAATNQQRWAFTDVNAGTRYARFFSDLASLDQVNWDAVATNDFREPVIKEGKQAEFLMHESFPLDLVERIGVHDDGVATRVRGILAGEHADKVAAQRTWYY